MGVCATATIDIIKNQEQEEKSGKYKYKYFQEGHYDDADDTDHCSDMWWRAVFRTVKSIASSYLAEKC